MTILDHISYRLYDLRSRLSAWWFWYSPPWRRTRLCPGCAGAKRTVNSYDERDCDVCEGQGRVPKLSP